MKIFFDDRDKKKMDKIYESAFLSIMYYLSMEDLVSVLVCCKQFHYFVNKQSNRFVRARILKGIGRKKLVRRKFCKFGESIGTRPAIFENFLVFKFLPSKRLYVFDSNIMEIRHIDKSEDWKVISINSNFMLVQKNKVYALLSHKTSAFIRILPEQCDFLQTNGLRSMNDEYLFVFDWKKQIMYYFSFEGVAVEIQFQVDNHKFQKILRFRRVTKKYFFLVASEGSKRGHLIISVRKPTLIQFVPFKMDRITIGINDDYLYVIDSKKSEIRSWKNNMLLRFGPLHSNYSYLMDFGIFSIQETDFDEINLFFARFEYRD